MSKFNFESEHYKVVIGEDKYHVINKVTGITEVKTEILPTACQWVNNLEKGWEEFVRQGGDPQIMTLN